MPLFSSFGIITYSEILLPKQRFLPLINFISCAVTHDSSKHIYTDFKKWVLQYQKRNNSVLDTRSAPSGFFINLLFISSVQYLSSCLCVACNLVGLFVVLF